MQKYHNYKYLILKNLLTTKASTRLNTRKSLPGFLFNTTKMYKHKTLFTGCDNGFLNIKVAITKNVIKINNKQSLL